MEVLFACKKGFRIRVNNIRYVAVLSPILISDITVNNSDIIEVNAEEKDLDIFDVRENFDSKCREFNELMNNSSIQHKPLSGIGTFTFLPPTKKGRPSGRKGGLAIETFQMISTPSSQGGHNRCNATWHSPRQP